MHSWFQVECRKVVRRDASGAVTVAADAREVEEASLHMRLAQLARMVGPLPADEKAAFAAAVRRQGNALFAAGDWDGATDLYMQSLVGLDFGPQSSSSAAVDNAAAAAAAGAESGALATESSKCAGKCAGVAATTTAIQVPVLCNLAACALAQRQWARAVLLCDYALALDPRAWKAHARKVTLR